MLDAMAAGLEIGSIFDSETTPDRRGSAFRLSGLIRGARRLRLSSGPAAAQHVPPVHGYGRCVDTIRRLVSRSLPTTLGTSSEYLQLPDQPARVS